MKENLKNKIRWRVFLPAYIILAFAAFIGIYSSDTLVTSLKAFFNWSIGSFGWLYAMVTIACLVLVIVLTFSKIGNLKIGGKDATPKYPFWTWFAMTLTGGVATGIVTWSVNEPLIYYGNVYGELEQLGIEPFSNEALHFALARCFHNWSFIPYSIYALSGILMAYIYFNKKEPLAVTSTLKPIFGEKISKGILRDIVDTLSMLAVALGLTTGLSVCITMITTGLNYSYGIEKNLNIFIIVGIFIIISFSLSSYVGLDKGLKKLANINAYFYYSLLILLLVTGSTTFIFKISTSSLGLWFKEFFLWSLDSGSIGGDALVKSWTMYDWAVWIAYAPVTGIFLAMISKGRTVKEFMIVNLLLPSVFGIIWFSIWGLSALNMQIEGSVNLVQTLIDNNAVTALWAFLKNLPFGIGIIIIPINIFVIYISFVTAADATSNNVASMCIKDVPIGSEAPAQLKVLWGLTLGIVAIILSAFGGSAQGVEGIKALGTAAGFVVLFIFTLQIISAIKTFFIDKLEE